ncbi:MAG: CBS domain-containing protein [Thiotrichaceae bacterium]
MSGIIRVKDVMNTDVMIVNGKDTLQDGLRKMRESYSRVLIVDKRHDDDEYGIVCMADIAKKVIAHDKSPERINIYEVMSKPAICVKESMDVRYCARLFHQFHLHSAPVRNDEGAIVGMVGYDDMVFKGLMKNL